MAVLDRCRDLTIVVNRAQAELVRVVAHAVVTPACEHDGKGSMGSRLRGHTHHSPAAAAAVVAAGRALPHLPVFAAAFTDGRVSAAQVSVVAAAVRPARVAAAAEQDFDVDAFDRVSTDLATSLPFGKLAQAVQVYLNALEPDGPEPDPTVDRSLTITGRPDGGLCGRLDLDAVGGEVVQAALGSVVQADRPWATPAPGPSRRPMPWSDCAPTSSLRGTCRCCGLSSRTWRSPSTCQTSPTPPPVATPRRWASGRRTPGPAVDHLPPGRHADVHRATPGLTTPVDCSAVPCGHQGDRCRCRRGVPQPTGSPGTTLRPSLTAGSLPRCPGGGRPSGLDGLSGVTRRSTS